MTDHLEVTLHRTEDAWLALINKVEDGLSKLYDCYNAPDPGTIEFAKYIDHTLLKLDATEEQIDQLCQEAREYKFKSVCVRLNYVPRAVSNLRGSSVDVACVVGFHEGTYSTTEKVTEALAAVQAGATELDVVLNHTLLNQHPEAPPYDQVSAELAVLRSQIHSPVVLKLILETSQLSRRNIIASCVLAKEAGFDFVKTSTGFSGEGATIDNVRLMKAVVGNGTGVKASGRVRSLKDCIGMTQAGATRIGTSSGVVIMREGKLGGSGGRIGNSEDMDGMHQGKSGH